MSVCVSLSLSLIRIAYIHANVVYNPSQEEVDYYKQFGLELGASDEDIKKRHKELALKYPNACRLHSFCIILYTIIHFEYLRRLHPDKNQDDPDAQKKFQEMQV